MRVLVFDFFPAVLAVDVYRDIVHGAGPVERVHGNKIVHAVGLELAQIVLHALRFELEHAHGFAPAKSSHVSVSPSGSCHRSMRSP